MFNFALNNNKNAFIWQKSKINNLMSWAQKS